MGTPLNDTEMIEVVIAGVGTKFDIVLDQLKSCEDLTYSQVVAALLYKEECTKEEESDTNKPGHFKRECRG